MIDFIKRLFQQYGYQILGKMNHIIVVKSDNFEDYWLIAEGLETFERQSKIHDELANGLLKDYPKFEKNTSLLLLVDGEANWEDNMSIEKDPFVFKKYVLNYTGATFAQMREMVEQCGGVENAVMNEEVFKCLANGRDNGGAALLYGIMHKLPFIPIKAHSIGENNVPLAFSDPQFFTWLEMFNNMSDSAEDISHFVDSLLIDENNEEA